MLREQNVLVFLGLFSVLNAELPSYTTKCNKNDPNLNSCLTKQGIIALDNLLKVNGNSSYADKLEPLSAPTFFVKAKNSNVVFEISNSVIYGLDKAEIKDISMDFKSQTLQIMYTGKSWHLVGAYKVSGQLLNKSLDHSGAIDIIIDNTLANYTAKYEPTNIDGSFYIQIKTSALPYTAEKISYNLTSQENKHTDKANELMNDLNNISSDLYQESKASLSSVAAGIIDTICNQFLRSETMCNLFDD